MTLNRVAEAYVNYGKKSTVVFRAGQDLPSRTDLILEVDGYGRAEAVIGAGVCHDLVACVIFRIT